MHRAPLIGVRRQACDNTAPFISKSQPTRRNMSAKLINGKEIAAGVRQQVAAGVEARTRKGLRAPGLAVVLVGNDPASEVYVGNKRKACDAAGILSLSYDLPADTSQQALEALVDELNENPAVDGILVQLPLPSHLDADPRSEERRVGKECRPRRPRLPGSAQWQVGRRVVVAVG